MTVNYYKKSIGGIMVEDFTQHAETENTVKTYSKPAIIHELKLETRAGSPLGIDPGVDPLGIDPTIE